MCGAEENRQGQGETKETTAAAATRVKKGCEDYAREHHACHGNQIPGAIRGCEGIHVGIGIDAEKCFGDGFSDGKCTGAYAVDSIVEHTTKTCQE